MASQIQKSLLINNIHDFYYRISNMEVQTTALESFSAY